VDTGTYQVKAQHLYWTKNIPLFLSRFNWQDCTVSIVYLYSI
jgi:hypothetical protein